MQKRSSSERAISALEPTVPADIGVRDSRRRIVDAMVASTGEKTYTETTISDIVAGASISRTTFYKRFPDKRACFDAAIDACIEEVRAVARGAHSPGDQPAVAVREGTAVVLRHLAANLAQAQLLTGCAPAVEPAVVERYRSLAIPALAALWSSPPDDSYLDPSLAFGRAQVLIFHAVASGRAERLPELLPQIVYLAVAPFAGHEEALRQVEAAERQAEDPPQGR